MCYHTKLSSGAAEVAKALKAEFLEKDAYLPKVEVNGFENPEYPLVRWDERPIIQYYEWGLLGDYLTEEKITKTDSRAIKARNGCLNAMLEELEQKKSFRTKILNRCIIPMDGMYEWQWEKPGDPKSKKTKYLVTKPNDGIFCCAGLYNEWHDPKTNFITYCYTICTTEGNELMKEIKNEGERMLVVLNENEYEHWLDPKVPFMAFWDRSHIELKAEVAIQPAKTKPTKGRDPAQTSLFN